MQTEKFIAKSTTSKLFIGKDGAIVPDSNKATIYDTVGECMKACIDANDNLGKAAFRLCKIYVDITK